MRPARIIKTTASAAVAAVLAAGMGLLAQAPAQAISNSPATAANTNNFVVKIDTGVNTCTGALVAAQWVATAASCFQANPADYAALPSGVPVNKIKVLFGTDTPLRDANGFGVVHVERHPDRDFAMVKLAKPVAGITPVKLASTALVANQQLSFTGFGRTHDTWVPDKKFTGTFTAGTLTSTTTQISGSAAGVSLCAGDSGAPGLRTVAGVTELVAVNSRSWQNGCLYAQTSNTGPGIGSRVDNITGWINTLVAHNVANKSVAQIRATGANGNCLYVKNGATETAKCGTSPDRKWEFTEVATDTYTIRNLTANTCLNGAADATASPQLAVAACAPANNTQRWQLLAQSDGTTIIKNVGNLASIQFQGTADTANVTQTKNTSTTLKWTLGTGDYFDLNASDVVAVNPDGTAYNLYQYEATTVPGLLNGVQMGQGWNDLVAGFVTDWNGDGFQDLIAQWNDGKIRLYKGSTKAFNSYEVIGQGWQGFQLTIGRWKDGDKYPSIVASNSGGTLYHYPNLNGVGIGASTVLGQGWSGLDIVQMDFDKDSHTDIVAKNSAGQLKLYRTNGAGVFIVETPPTIGVGWDVITAISPTSGFAGPGTTGMLARTTTGELKYYGITANGTWEAPKNVGVGWTPLKIFRSTMP